MRSLSTVNRFLLATSALLVSFGATTGIANAVNTISYTAPPQDAFSISHSASEPESLQVVTSRCLVPETTYSFQFNARTQISESGGAAIFQASSSSPDLVRLGFSPPILTGLTGDMTTPARFSFTTGPATRDTQEIKLYLQPNSREGSSTYFEFDNYAIVYITITCVRIPPVYTGTTPSTTPTGSTPTNTVPTTTTPTNTTPTITTPTVTTNTTTTPVVTVQGPPTPVTVTTPKTVIPTRSLEQCTKFTAARKAWALTKWKGNKTRVRLETKSGAYIYKSRENKAQILLKARGIDNGSAQVKKVSFRIDGVPAKAVKRDVWSLSLKPQSMSVGKHVISAKVQTGDKRVNLNLTIYISACEPKRYTFATSSKLRRAHPNLRLWWQAGDAFPTEVTANIPAAIRIHAAQLRKYRGRVLGGIQVTQKDGTKHYVKLRIPRTIPASRNVKLLSEASGLTVSFTAKTGGKVSVTGIPDHVNQVRVWLRGKTIKLFQNVNRCSSLNSTAEMKNATSSLKLVQAAKLCTNKR